jgi:predicted enzyme related to lactoylglutathione lyase
MLNVEGLAGVIISTSPERYAPMEAFYLSLLGPHVRSQRPGFVNFQWNDQRLTVTTHREVTGEATQPARIMVNLAVTDVDRTARALEDMGTGIIRPPETEAWGGRICTAADPDGNYIQFLQLA